VLDAGSHAGDVLLGALEGNKLQGLVAVGPNRKRQPAGAAAAADAAMLRPDNDQQCGCWGIAGETALILRTWQYTARNQDAGPCCPKPTNNLTGCLAQPNIASAHSGGARLASKLPTSFDKTQCDMVHIPLRGVSQGLDTKVSQPKEQSTSKEDNKSQWN
jgi:hypothetical protein